MSNIGSGSVGLDTNLNGNFAAGDAESGTGIFGGKVRLGINPLLADTNIINTSGGLFFKLNIGLSPFTTGAMMNVDSGQAGNYLSALTVKGSPGVGASNSLVDILYHVSAANLAGLAVEGDNTPAADVTLAHFRNSILSLNITNWRGLRISPPTISLGGAPTNSFALFIDHPAIGTNRFYLAVQAQPSDGNVQLQIFSGANVGLLERAVIGATATDWRVFLQSAGVTNNERLTILGASGFVGINNNTPTTALHVIGAQVTFQKAAVPGTQGYAIFSTGGVQLALFAASNVGAVQIGGSVAGQPTTIGSNGITTLTLDAANNAQFVGNIKTGQGALTVAPLPWNLGTVIAAAVALDATHYVETAINGVIVKLAIVV